MVLGDSISYPKLLLAIVLDKFGVLRMSDQIAQCTLSGHLYHILEASLHIHNMHNN